MVIEYAGRFFVCEGRVYEASQIDPDAIHPVVKNPIPPPWRLRPEDATVRIWRGYRFSGQIGQEKWLGREWRSDSGGSAFEVPT